MTALLLAAAPAVPNDIGGRYVAGAYIVFVLLLVIYVAIMARKLLGIERDLREIAAIAEARKEEGEGGEPRKPVPAADQAGPGRGGEEQSRSDSLASHETRGAGA